MINSGGINFLLSFFFENDRLDDLKFKIINYTDLTCGPNISIPASTRSLNYVSSFGKINVGGVNFLYNVDFSSSTTFVIFDIPIKYAPSVTVYAPIFYGNSICSGFMDIYGSTNTAKIVGKISSHNKNDYLYGTLVWISYR